MRSQFLSELAACAIRDIHDLNARWWVWIEQAYHLRPHQGLDNELIVPFEEPPAMNSYIESSERLGGLLRSYRRAA